MASSIYLGWSPPVTRWDEMSFVCEMLQDPPVGTGTIFWATQMTFRQSNDDPRGGAHCGFIWTTNATTPRGINWGGYDDGADEIQRVTITGSPTGGTFTLTYSGQTTAAIAYNAAASAVDSALEALSNIAAGEVECTGGPLPGTPVDVVFRNGLGKGDRVLMTAANSLTGGTSPAIAITEKRKGYAQIGNQTTRGSLDGLPMIDGNATVRAYAWQTERPYRFRLFRSPKQNYVASELSTDGLLTGDQQTGEVAWRLTVTDLTTGTETYVRDLLYADSAASSAMSDASSWSEDFNNASAPTATQPWQVRWTQPRVDNRLAPTMTATYSTGAGALTNTDVNTADKVGWRMVSVTTRTVTGGTTLDHPGVVSRSWASAATGGTFAASITISKPLGAASPDRLVAYVMCPASNAGFTTPTGWTLLGSGRGTAPHNGDEAYLFVFSRIADGSSSYAFSLASGTEPLAGAIVAYYYALGPTRAYVGTFEAPDSGGSTWGAPSVTDPYHLSRVAYAVGSRWAGSGSSYGVPAGAVERADTSDITTSWAGLAVGDFAIPGRAGVKAAVSAAAALGNYAAVQTLIAPVQVIRPDADLSNTGWTTAPLWSKVDDSPIPDDADYITGGDAAVSELRLTTATDPLLSGGHTLRVRARKQDSAGTTTVQGKIKQGATVIATKTTAAIPISDTFVDYEFTLTGPETDAITNYAAPLSVELTAAAT